MSASATPPQTRTVHCPSCGEPARYSPENPHRPFCSKRCKTQDLGAWASESFRVEVAEDDGAELPHDSLEGSSPQPGRH